MSYKVTMFINRQNIDSGFYTSTWDINSKKYFEAVLNSLEIMTAYYSYGNGEITLDQNSAWHSLNLNVIIPMINGAIKPDLSIKVSETNSNFPTKLWFEMEGIINESDENEQ